MFLRSLLIGSVVSSVTACVDGIFAADSIPAWASNRDEQLPQSRADHLARLGVSHWHTAGFRGKGMKIAVLDSGFRGYRHQMGKSLPARLVARSARQDKNMEAKDSQHGILCGEIVHAIAPDAELLFANWDPDSPESFLDAVRWAREQGAQIITCSIIMPSWSDGEGSGPIHRRLRSILGDGTKPGDPLFFSCAGNVAERHWAGTFRSDSSGFHLWSEREIDNRVYPWGDERVSLELCWSDPAARYQVDVIDPTTGLPVQGCSCRNPDDRLCTVVRFTPKGGQSYAVRVRQVKGNPGRFHFTSLAAELGTSRAAGSIPFPGDGPEVITVGAIHADGQRARFSACGPNSSRPKPDVVAPIPFGTFLRDRPFSGTSCATPQAAAIAALVWSGTPGWSAARIRSYLTSRTRDLGPTGHDCETGFGVVHLPAIAPAPHVRVGGASSVAGTLGMP